jgi:hypothetical protein
MGGNGEGAEQASLRMDGLLYDLVFFLSCGVMLTALNIGIAYWATEELPAAIKLEAVRCGLGSQWVEENQLWWVVVVTLWLWPWGVLTWLRELFK